MKAPNFIRRIVAIIVLVYVFVYYGVAIFTITSPDTKTRMSAPYMVFTLFNEKGN